MSNREIERSTLPKLSRAATFVLLGQLTVGPALGELPLSLHYGIMRCVPANDICIEFGGGGGPGGYYPRRDPDARRYQTVAYLGEADSEPTAAQGHRKWLAAHIGQALESTDCFRLIDSDRLGDLKARLQESSAKSTGDLPLSDLISIKSRGIDYLAVGLVSQGGTRDEVLLSVSLHSVDDHGVFSESTSLPKGIEDWSPERLSVVAAQLCAKFKEETNLSPQEHREDTLSIYDSERPHFVRNASTSRMLSPGLVSACAKTAVFEMPRSGAQTLYRPTLRSPEVNPLPRIREPRWAFYASWNSQDTGLTLHDTVSGENYYYPVYANEFTLADEHLANEGELLQSSPLSYTDALLVNSKSGVTEPVVGSLLDWKASGENGIAYGNFVDAKGAWTVGYFHFYFDEILTLRSIRQLRDDSQRLPLYHLGNPYVAIHGKNAYFIVLDDTPALYKVALGGDGLAQVRRMNSFPGEDFYVPNPARITNARQAVDFLNSIESSTMPTGLYVHGEFLYLITRKPATNGTGIEWAAHKIDPERDSLLSSTILPTTAKHLLAIPGRKAWALIEKGRIDALGDQEVKSIRFINLPSGRLDKRFTGGLRAELWDDLEVKPEFEPRGSRALYVNVGR